MDKFRGHLVSARHLVWTAPQRRQMRNVPWRRSHLNQHVPRPPQKRHGRRSRKGAPETPTTAPMKTVGLMILHECKRTLARASFACARPLRTAAIRRGTLLRHWTERNFSIHNCWHQDVECSSDLHLRYRDTTSRIGGLLHTFRAHLTVLGDSTIARRQARE